MYTDILFLIGRILFGGYFTMMGINHFKNKGMLAGYAKSKNVPSPGVAVMGSGAFLLVGGLATIAGMTQVAAPALTIFLIPVTLKMHAFWEDADPMMKMNDMTHFLKNTALLGATWMMF